MSGGKRRLPRCLGGLAVLLALSLILVLAMVLPWKARMTVYDEEIEQRNRQLAGYKRVISTLPSLREQLESAREARRRDAFYIAVTDPSLGGIALQRLMEDLVTAAGANLTSIQVLGLQQEESASRVGVRLRFTGPTEALQKLVYGIESNQPALFIGTSNIRSLRQRRPRRAARNEPQKETIVDELNVNMDVYGYIRSAEG